MKRPDTNPTAAECPTAKAQTLEQLGVPAPLAAELEVVFRAMGSVHGGQLDGRAFVTHDGRRHAVEVREV